MSRHIEAMTVIAVAAVLAGLPIPAGVMDRRPERDELKCTACMHALAAAMRHSGDVYPLTDSPMVWKLLCDGRFPDPGIECPADPFPRAMPGMTASYLYFGSCFPDAPPQRGDGLISVRNG